MKAREIKTQGDYEEYVRDLTVIYLEIAYDENDDLQTVLRERLPYDDILNHAGLVLRYSDHRNAYPDQRGGEISLSGDSVSDIIRPLALESLKFDIQAEADRLLETRRIQVSIELDVIEHHTESEQEGVRSNVTFQQDPSTLYIQPVADEVRDRIRAWLDDDDWEGFTMDRDAFPEEVLHTLDGQKMKAGNAVQKGIEVEAFLEAIDPEAGTIDFPDYLCVH
jgi:hypothetical protein